MCNFNHELNEMNSRIAQSVHNPGDFGTCRNLCREVKLCGSTSVIAVFLAVAKTVNYSVIHLIPLIGSKSSCIFLKPKTVRLSTIGLCGCNNVTT